MKRALVGVAVLAVLGALLVSPPRPTVAAWADSETSTGSFAAYTVPKPTITSCPTVFGFDGLTIDMKWRYNSTTPTPTATFWFSSTSMASLAPLASGFTTTGPTAGVYTTTYGTALLNPYRGHTVYIGVSATQLGWSSPTATATAALPPSAPNSGPCTVTP